MRIRLKDQEPARLRRYALLASLAVALAGAPCRGPDAAQAPEDDAVLRVCSDANNLPYSNAAGEGFENAIARLVAEEMGRHVEYAWWPQRRGFIRNTLAARKCDVVVGVPTRYERTATTRPYYRSGYVAVTRAADELDIRRLEDPQLRELQIGVHTIGDDYSNPPPAQILGALGVQENVHGYSVFGNYAEPSPLREPVDAVARGDIDVAILWGPVAGFFAADQSVPLKLTPVGSSSSDLPMAFDIGIGVRREDHDLLHELDAILERRSRDIASLLRRFGIPTEGFGAQPAAARSTHEERWEESE